MRRLALCAVLLAFACGGPTGIEDQSTPPGDPPEPDLGTETTNHSVVVDIDLTPQFPEWMNGSLTDVEAVALDSSGARVDSFDIQWESLNTAITTVSSEMDTLATLSGNGLGRATLAVYVQGQNGATVRHANVFVDEPLPSDDTEPPTLDSLALSTDSIGPGEKVNVRVFASDPKAGVYKVIVGFRPAGDTDDRHTSQGSMNESGTWHDGQWILGGSADRLLEAGAAGEWEVSVLLLDRCDQPHTCPDDGSDHSTSLSPDQLGDAGWPHTFTVTN